MAELRSGYDYQIPGQFINMQQPAVGPIAPTEGGMATDAVDPRNPLANRGKLTSDYFNNYAALDAYAKEMNKQGINIFAPDYTSEGGGIPFQIGLQLQASVLHAANKLQNEFAAEQQLRPLIAKGDVRRRSDVDPNSLWAQDPSSVYGTQPVASIQEANLRNRENLYTQGDSNRRNQETSQVLSRIDQAVAQGIMSPEEGELQKSYYIKNTPQVNPYTLRPPKPGSNYDYQLGVLRKFTNLSQGIWNPGTYKQVVRNGKTYLLNEDGKGDVLGKYETTDSNGNTIVKDRVLNGWLMDPETNQVFLEYTDGGRDLASNQPGDAITRTFIANNSKYGSVDKFYEAAQATGILDPTGSSINASLTPTNAGEIRSGIAQGAQPAAQAQAQRAQEVNNKLSSLEAKTWYNPRTWTNTSTESFPLPSGQQVIVGKDSDGNFYIDNFSDIDPKGKQSDYQKLSLDDIQNYLSQLGYYDQPVEQPTAPQGKRVSRATIQSKIGQPGFEGYTLDELIQYYASQGYEVY